jgi:hypothetical protein
VTIHDSSPQDFIEWLADQLGTRKWVVARKSKKRIKEGYEVFLTQMRFTALKRYFEKESGEMEADGISQHLTEPDLDFARKRKDTFEGMAFWASTGPAGKTCRGCMHWKSDGYSPCGKYKSLMHGQDGGRVPHYAKSCKYFLETSTPPALEKPRSPVTPANRAEP